MGQKTRHRRTWKDTEGADQAEVVDEMVDHASRWIRYARVLRGTRGIRVIRAIRTIRVIRVIRGACLADRSRGRRRTHYRKPRRRWSL